MAQKVEGRIRPALKIHRSHAQAHVEGFSRSLTRNGVAAAAGDEDRIRSGGRGRNDTVQKERGSVCVCVFIRVVRRLVCLHSRPATEKKSLFFIFFPSKKATFFLPRARSTNQASSVANPLSFQFRDKIRLPIVM